MSWFKKMMNFMFDDEPSETEETVNPSIHKQEKTIPSKRSIGRFQNGQNHAEARMVSRYPSEGKFRFPLISDEEGIGSEKRYEQTYKQNYQENYQQSYQKKAAEKWVEKKPYTPPQEPKKEYRNEQQKTAKPPGTPEEKKAPFKPSEIPSPIYGFGSREKKNSSSGQDTKSYQPSAPTGQFRPSEIPSPIYGFGNRDSKGESSKQSYEERPKSNFKPSQVPSPIYGYGERKPDTILNPGLWKLSEIQKKRLPDQELMDELLKDPVSTKEPIILESDIDNRNDKEGELNEDISHLPEEKADEPVILLEDFKIEKPEPLIMEVVEESSDEPKIFDIEAEYVETPGVELPQKAHSEPELVYDLVMDQPEPEAEVVTDEEKAVYAEAEEANQAAPAIEEERPMATTAPQPAPVPEKKPGGSYVPFNVLMLKKDRRATVSKQEIKSAPVQEIKNTPVQEVTSPPPAPTRFPQLDLLDHPPIQEEDDSLWMEEQRDLLQLTLDNFNVNARVVNMTKGPSVTRLEVQPAPGVKVNKITNLSDDIKLSLSAKDIRIEAPIPGKNTIGIEVPNRNSQAVFLREILQSEEFQQSASPLTVALGLDLSGAPIVTDLQKMPHGLIAGATGSGKSVCINSILVSLMYKASPDDVRLLLVDPKMVELAPYHSIPHLVTQVITDPKEATVALKWTVEEMERRYEAFARHGVRDIKRFNDKMKTEQLHANKMPYIVVVIDELADLMMVSPQDVEEAICRIAQKARACGIHLLLATQRPSVDVITGLIKANIPTRVAFAVSSAIDSRTIIDISGAERLLGRGDMLFMENGSSKAVRIQGTYVSDEEIEQVTAFVKDQYPTNYLFSREELVQSNHAIEQEDDLFEEACYYVLDVGAASSSSIQRRFRVGFNRAARLVEMMEAFGLVSEAMGSKPRNVLMSQEEFQSKMYSEAEA